MKMWRTRCSARDNDMTQCPKTPDAGCHLLGHQSGPARVAKNSQQRHEDALFMSHGIANRKFIEIAGDAANGVIFPAGSLS